MWVFYLAMCEALFDGIGYQVAQVVFRPGREVTEFEAAGRAWGAHGPPFNENVDV